MIPEFSARVHAGIGELLEGGGRAIRVRRGQAICAAIKSMKHPDSYLYFTHSTTIKSPLQYSTAESRETSMIIFFKKLHRLLLGYLDVQ